MSKMSHRRARNNSKKAPVKAVVKPQEMITDVPNEGAGTDVTVSEDTVYKNKIVTG